MLTMVPLSLHWIPLEIHKIIVPGSGDGRDAHRYNSKGRMGGVGISIFGPPAATIRGFGFLSNNYHPREAPYLGVRPGLDWSAMGEPVTLKNQYGSHSEVKSEGESSLSVNGVMQITKEPPA